MAHTAVHNGHGHDSHDHAHDDGHHDQESLKTFGFWLFLITDCILFGTLFATYVVLRANTNGGPTPEELFLMPGIIAETFILLTSSFTSGLAVLAMHQGKKKPADRLAGGNRAAGRCLHYAGGVGIRAYGARRSDNQHQRVPVELLRPGRDARYARLARARLDGRPHASASPQRHYAGHQTQGRSNQPVLAFSRRRLDFRVHGRLFDGGDVGWSV